MARHAGSSGTPSMLTGPPSRTNDTGAPIDWARRSVALGIKQTATVARVTVNEADEIRMTPSLLVSEASTATKATEHTTSKRGFVQMRRRPDEARRTEVRRAGRMGPR